MDDRGEGATFESVPELVEDDISTLLDDALDVTAGVPSARQRLEDDLDATAVLAAADRSALIDEFDATVVTSSDSEGLLDSTLDETVVATEAVPNLIAEGMQDLDELDATVVSVEQDDDSNVLLSGLVGLIEPVDVVDRVEGAFDQFESDAPAPPPVCTVAGAGVPNAKAQRLVPGPRWVEKDGRAVSSTVTRGYRFLLLLIVAAAVGYVFYLYQRGSVEGEEPVSLAKEMVPPKGQDLMLAPAQVRYCVAQGIRLGSAAEQAVGLSAAASARMRLVFNDFDQRCTDYQFEPGSFLAVEQGVEADRAILEQQGLSLLASIKLINDPLNDEFPEPVAQSEAALEVPVLTDARVVEAIASGVEVVSIPEELPMSPSEPDQPVEAVANAPIASISQEPRRIIKDMQWRLFKLGLFNGSMSGVYGESTQFAVKEFFRTHGDIAESRIESEIYSAIDSVYVKR